MFIKAVLNCCEFAEGVATMFPFPLSTGQSPLNTPVDGSVMVTPVSGVSSDLGELSSNLSCFIMELDLLVKQVYSVGHLVIVIVRLESDFGQFPKGYIPRI